MWSFIAVILASSLLVQSASAYTPSADIQATANDFACVNDSTWTAPQKPFRIYGNTWHVGPRGLGIFLIKGSTGHVLIDGGVQRTHQL